MRREHGQVFLIRGIRCTALVRPSLQEREYLFVNRRSCGQQQTVVGNVLKKAVLEDIFAFSVRSGRKNNIRLDQIVDRRARVILRNVEDLRQNVALDRPSFSTILGQFRRRPDPNSGRGHRPSSKAPEVDDCFDMYFKFLKSDLGKLDLRV